MEARKAKRNSVEAKFVWLQPAHHGHKLAVIYRSVAILVDLVNDLIDLLRVHPKRRIRERIEQLLPGDLAVTVFVELGKSLQQRGNKEHVISMVNITTHAGPFIAAYLL